MNEIGGGQPTAIDVLCESMSDILCIESKFATDAASGFSGCSQFAKRKCSGFYGPGSDARTGTAASCRLEIKERKREPREYWSLGRHWFRPEVFEQQSAGSTCPLRGSNYQLMRNFLFAASIAENNSKSYFGVLTIGPRRYSSILERQVSDFRDQILKSAFANRIAFINYESYTEILLASGDRYANALGAFLNQRIDNIVG